MSFEPVLSNLKDCDESVQYTVSIQPEGCFISINAESLQVNGYSTGLEKAFGIESRVMSKTSVKAIFDSDTVDRIRPFLSSAQLNFQGQHYIDLGFVSDSRKVRAVVYQSRNIICLEWPNTCADESLHFTELEVANIIYQIQMHSGTDSSLSKFVCSLLRKYTAYDRVYFCEFSDDGEGIAVENDVSTFLPSIKNNRFPPSDIPPTVRELYIKSKFRSVTNIKFKPVKIIHDNDQPFDLTYSVFRAIAKPHLNYLEQMGVLASASFSVVEGNFLRGIIGFHSKSTMQFPFRMIHPVERIVSAFAAKLSANRIAKIKSKRIEMGLGLVSFASSYESAQCKVARMPIAALESVKEALEAPVVFCRSGDLVTSSPPIPEKLSQLIIDFAEKELKTKDFFTTDNLVSERDDFREFSDTVAGMIFLSMDRGHSCFMTLMRPESKKIVNWGAGGNQISIEQVLKSENWDQSTIDLAKEFRLKLLNMRSSYLEQIAKNNAELIKKNDENVILLSEVHHRVKNNLAIVCSMFDWKIKELTDAELIRSLTEMKSRIRAIATLHQTLYQGSTFGFLDLNRYLKTLAGEVISLMPHAGCEILLSLNVPKGLSVAVSDGLPIGMIAHEFVANSIKHAFNSRAKGKIGIEWSSSAEIDVLEFSDDGIGRVDISTLKGSSLGLQLIRLLTGQLDVQSVWSGENGISLKLYFPKGFLK